MTSSPYVNPGMGGVPDFRDPNRVLRARDLHAIAMEAARIAAGGAVAGSGAGGGRIRVRRGPNGQTTVGMEPRRREGRPVFFARITGNATDGDNRWKYAWKEVRLGPASGGTGYSGWEDVPDGRTGATGEATAARNWWEEMNSSTGTQGTGVDVANLEGTYTHKAIPTNLIVQMHVVREADGEEIEYWFGAPQGIDGGCA